jgi:uncharacterized protein (TIGR03067 family)
MGQTLSSERTEIVRILTLALCLLVFDSIADAQFNNSLPEYKQPAVSRVLALDEYVSVPLFLKKGSFYLYLRAEIAGEKIIMLLDTGATNTSISHKLAKKLKLVLTNENTIKIDGSNLKRWQSTIPDLRCGQFSRGSTGVDLIDMEELVTTLKQKDNVEIDGILGANILDPYCAIIDYRNRALFMRDIPAVDRNRLQGKWKGISLIHAGNPIKNNDYIDKGRLTIENETITFEQDGEVLTGKLILESDGNPKWLEFVDVKRNGVQQKDTLVCLYEITENRLRVLMPSAKRLKKEDYPSKIVSTKENGTGVWTFVRFEVLPPPRMKLNP